MRRWFARLTLPEAGGGMFKAWRSKVESPSKLQKPAIISRSHHVEFEDESGK